MSAASDPTFVAVAVLLGATLDEATASLDDAHHAAEGDAALSQVLTRALQSSDRMMRARALAAGVEPVMRELAAWEDIGEGSHGETE